MAMTSVLNLQKSLGNSSVLKQITQGPSAGPVQAIPSKSTSSLAAAESNSESVKRQDQMIDLLDAIKNNTAKMVDILSKGKGGSKKEEEDEKGGGIGWIGASLAASLGAIAGLLSGYIKLLKAFAEFIIPEAWLAKIKGAVTVVVDFFSGVGKWFENLKTLLGLGEGGTLSKIISSGVEAVKRWGSWIGDFIGKIKGFFSGVVEWGGSFAKIFKTAFAIFEKLAWPLTIFMTLWDTVKGAFAGFEKGGIVGAIGGAIKGFFNALIFGPLDLIKDAIAWVLGVFGFDKAEKWLKSFSFEEMFNKLVDQLMAPFRWLQEKVIKLWEEFSWDETWGKITTFVTESIDSVVTGFNKLKDGIIEWWDSWSISDIIDNIGKQVSEISDAIKNWFGEKLNKVKNFFGFGESAQSSEEAKAVQRTSLQLKSAEALRGGGGAYEDVDPELKKKQDAIKAKNEEDIKRLAAKGFNESELRGEDRNPDAGSRLKTFLTGKKEEKKYEDDVVINVGGGSSIADRLKKSGGDLQKAYADDDDSPKAGKTVTAASSSVEDAKVQMAKSSAAPATTAVVNAPVTNNQNNFIRANTRNQESSQERVSRERYDRSKDY